MRHSLRGFAAFAALATALGLPGSVAAGTQFHYDALGRLTRVTYETGVVVQYSYDAAGNRSQVVTSGLNRPPVAISDSANVTASTSVDIMVRANDIDRDGDPLTVTAVGTPSGGGAASIAGGGTHVRYTAPPAAGTETFSYTISDGRGGTATSVVTVNVGGANRPPVATDDSYRVLTGHSVNLYPVHSDSDPDGDPLVITNIGPVAGGGSAYAIHSAGMAWVRFTAPSTAGNSSFTYTISDGRGGQATATVYVEVYAPNRPPVAVNDSASVNASASIDIMVLANDSDPDGNPLSVSAVNVPAGAGTATIAGGGAYVRYTAPATGGVRTFTYTLSDGSASTREGTVTVNVMAPNRPPVAVNDTAYADTLTSISIPVLSNDSDPDGQTLTITGVTTPAKGTASIASGARAVIYNAPSTAGTYTFQYTASDGAGGTAIGTVSVVVQRVIIEDPGCLTSGVTSMRPPPGCW